MKDQEINYLTEKMDKKDNEINELKNEFRNKNTNELSKKDKEMNSLKNVNNVMSKQINNLENKINNLKKQMDKNEFRNQNEKRTNELSNRTQKNVNDAFSQKMLDIFGSDDTQQIIPSSSWYQLQQILYSLKKMANANKDDVAQRDYRDAVAQLLSAFNTLTNETETKLLIELNEDNINTNDQKILELKKGLKNVRRLVETVYPHLYGKIEKDKVQKKEKALGLLLSDRLKQLMRAAVQCARKRDFTQCEKRLDNLSRLMDYNIQFYMD
eukprot:531816_1